MVAVHDDDLVEFVVGLCGNAVSWHFYATRHINVSSP
jgi:hypothetical protein